LVLVFGLTRDGRLPIINKKKPLGCAKIAYSCSPNDQPFTTLFKTTLNTTAHIPMPTSRTYDGRADTGGSPGRGLFLPLPRVMALKLDASGVQGVVEEDVGGDGDGDV